MQTEAYTRACRAHSTVEMVINALEVHGLDKCPDHAIDGFNRPLKNYCDRLSFALRDVRSPAYPLDMSRALRSIAWHLVILTALLTTY